MNKHTPGPWHVIAHDQVRDADGQFIASCELPKVNFRKGEAEANALLIAAAPDLLETLRELVIAWAKEPLNITCDDGNRLRIMAKATKLCNGLSNG